MEIRPYDPETDRSGLYDCKLAFERGIGADTGGEEKAETYEEKLTGTYREEWLAWVDRCVEDDPRCVTVAERGGEGATSSNGPKPSDAAVVGYVFCLPERLAFVWDAAVINELYVAPSHRGTGVADDLMESALELAADQDLPLDRVVLDVDRENERARRFYDRYGFEHWGEMIARPLAE